MTPLNEGRARHLGDRISRTWWVAVGFVCVGVGSLGIVVPGLPTTIFFIMAAWCFHRSSPRFERWVLGLPRIGSMVADHRAGLGMSRRAKRFALSMMWAAVSLSAFATRDRWLVAVLIVAAGLVGTAYIVRRVPTRERVLGSRQFDAA